MDFRVHDNYRNVQFFSPSDHSYDTLQVRCIKRTYGTFLAWASLSISFNDTNTIFLLLFCLLSLHILTAYVIPSG